MEEGNIFGICVFFDFSPSRKIIRASSRQNLSFGVFGNASFKPVSFKLATETC